mmetsp:Transcript_11477/g.15485  ORF Transcript_11477/g.15485 Transcript_11477/m.15485 type:complete len:115 (+) Transcript_11477:95-439(+)
MFPFSGEDESSSFFSMKASEPIRFKVEKKRMPFNPHLFFRVVCDVNSYPEFIPSMPGCHIDQATAYEQLKSNKIVKGGFDAPTRIGFNAVSFDYISRVTYEHPQLPVNLHPSCP